MFTRLLCIKSADFTDHYGNSHFTIKEGDTVSAMVDYDGVRFEYEPNHLVSHIGSKTLQKVLFQNLTKMHITKYIKRQAAIHMVILSRKFKEAKERYESMFGHIISGV